MSTNQTYDELSAEVMLRLADGMAAAAASFSAHGYDQFILAREVFIGANDCVWDRMKQLETAQNHRSPRA